jgi:WD40 repeat protein
VKHYFCTTFIFLLLAGSIQGADVRAVIALEGHTDTVHFAAFSPDGTKIVTVDDKSPRIWVLP